MNCKSVNALHDFEFHDAYWEFAAWDAASLSVFAKHLNLHQDAPRNDSDCDMEIQLAGMTFEGFRAISYAPGVAWETDENGQSRPAEPLKVYEGDAAHKAFLRELQHGVNLLALRQKDECWMLIGCGAEPYFEVQFSFENVIVEWDAFKGPAWYVLRQREIQA